VCEPCSGTALDCNTGTTSIVACDDGNANTINDEQTILDCDGSICIPCMGTLVDCSNGSTSEVSCDDDDPCTTNDVQTILDVDGSICIPCAGIPIDETQITANDDEYEVIYNQSITGNVLDNDELLDFEQLIIQVVEMPMYGVLTIGDDGAFEYTSNNPNSSSDQFMYEFCAEDCPEICGTALVNIVIQFDDLLIPDAFSPNEDGGLLQKEQRKLIVVNRWGSVVYEAESYENDWNGKTNSGQELPEGTYYYYLSMGVNEGTREGSITIIK